MRTLTLRQVAHITRGSTLLPYEQLVTALSTDSRSVAPGALFLALRGERFDGHDFVASTLTHGAIPVVARTHPVADPTTMLLVDDPQSALLALASALRLAARGKDSDLAICFGLLLGLGVIWVGMRLCLPPPAPPMCPQLSEVMAAEASFCI